MALGLEQSAYYHCVCVWLRVYLSEMALRTALTSKLQNSRAVGESWIKAMSVGLCLTFWLLLSSPSLSLSLSPTSVSFPFCILCSSPALFFLVVVFSLPLPELPFFSWPLSPFVLFISPQYVITERATNVTLNFTLHLSL